MGSNLNFFFSLTKRYSLYFCLIFGIILLSCFPSGTACLQEEAWVPAQAIYQAKFLEEAVIEGAKAKVHSSAWNI